MSKFVVKCAEEYGSDPDRGYESEEFNKKIAERFFSLGYEKLNVTREHNARGIECNAPALANMRACIKITNQAIEARVSV